MVDPDERNPVAERFMDRLQHRHLRAARNTPRRPKVDHQRPTRKCSKRNPAGLTAKAIEHKGGSPLSNECRHRARGMQPASQHNRRSHHDSGSADDTGGDESPTARVPQVDNARQFHAVQRGPNLGAVVGFAGTYAGHGFGVVVPLNISAGFTRNASQRYDTSE